jgi:hypothetical protein
MNTKQALKQLKKGKKVKKTWWDEGEYIVYSSLIPPIALEGYYNFIDNTGNLYTISPAMADDED